MSLTFHKFVLGETVAHPNVRYFFMSGHWEQLQDRLKHVECDVVLKRSFSTMNPSITIYGRRQHITQAQIEINRQVTVILRIFPRKSHYTRYSTKKSIYREPTV